MDVCTMWITNIPSHCQLDWLRFPDVAEDDWREAFLQFFRVLFFAKLLMNPSDKKILLCSQPDSFDSLNAIIESVLFAKFQCSSVTWIPASCAVLSLVKQMTGLVIDIGEYESRFVPVIEGRIVSSAVVHAQLGIFQLKQQLRVKLLDYLIESKQKVPENPGQLLSNAVLSDLCLQFLQHSGQSQDEPTTLATFSIAIPREASTKYVLPWVFQFPLSLVHEAVEQVFFVREEDISLNLCLSLMECLNRCSRDARAVLHNKLVFVGGGSELFAIPSRLLQQFDDLTQSPEFQSLSGLTHKLRRNSALNVRPFIAAFVGACTAGSVESFMSGPAGKKLPQWQEEQAQAAVATAATA